MKSTVEEATYWYNVIPKDDTPPITAPPNHIYRYVVRLKGIHSVPPMMSEMDHKVYEVGNHVLVKAPHNMCTKTLRKGPITGHVSTQTADEMPRHAEDIRPSLSSRSSSSSEDDMFETEEEIVVSVNRPDEPTGEESHGDKVGALEKTFFGEVPERRDPL